MKVAMSQQHSQVSCVGVGTECKYCKVVLCVSGNRRNIIRAEGISFPPNGLVFLNVICKILREELILLRHAELSVRPVLLKQRESSDRRHSSLFSSKDKNLEPLGQKSHK